MGRGRILYEGIGVGLAGAVAVLGSWLLDTLQPWAILGGNFVAALMMLGILFRDHHFSLHEALA